MIASIYLNLLAYGGKVSLTLWAIAFVVAFTDNPITEKQWLKFCEIATLVSIAYALLYIWSY